MTRRLYAWEKDGAFYLSVFVRPVLDFSGTPGRRPAVEFIDRAALETEAQRRDAELVWQTDGN